MRKASLQALLAAGALLLASTSARTDETRWCNFIITTLPYTVNSQGHYCFDRNLSTAITTGNAITVNSDYVILDLNNFKLGGGSAGLATDAIGIYSFDRSNLTVRGGNIRGFAFGIAVDGTTSSSARNILIENNVVDGNLKGGIVAGGTAVVIRHNLVSNTGGSTSTVPYCPELGAASGFTMGISTVPPDCGFSGESYQIHDNTVLDTSPHAGGNSAYGIRGTASAMGALIRRNTVNGVSGSLKAIVGGLDSAVCRDNDVLNSPGGGYDCTQVGTNSYN